MLTIVNIYEYTYIYTVIREYDYILWLSVSDYDTKWIAYNIIIIFL